MLQCDLGPSSVSQMIDKIAVVDARIANKSKQIEEAQHELELLREEKSHTIERLIVGYSILGASQLETAFHAFNHPESAPKGSPEASTLDLVENTVLYSCFEDEILHKYQPMLKAIACYGYNSYAFSFEYEMIDGHRLYFTVPTKYCLNEEGRETYGNGKFEAYYEESPHVLNYIKDSYSEKEIRDAITDWIKKNCKTSAPKTNKTEKNGEEQR